MVKKIPKRTKGTPMKISPPPRAMAVTIFSGKKDGCFKFLICSQKYPKAK